MQYFYSTRVTSRSSECTGGSALRTPGPSPALSQQMPRARAREGPLGVKGLEECAHQGHGWVSPCAGPGGCRWPLWACAKVNFV